MTRVFCRFRWSDLLNAFSFLLFLLIQFAFDAVVFVLFLFMPLLLCSCFNAFIFSFYSFMPFNHLTLNRPQLLFGKKKQHGFCVHQTPRHFCLDTPLIPMQRKRMRFPHDRPDRRPLQGNWSMSNSRLFL